MKKALGSGTISSYEPSLDMNTRRLLSDLVSKGTIVEDALLRYVTLLLLNSSPRQLRQIHLECYALDLVRTPSHVI